MAHSLTPQEIDEAAATAAGEAAAGHVDAAAQPQEQEATLAYGAEGECVTKLVNLLALLGHAMNDVVKGGHPILDQTVLTDVLHAQEELQVVEPDLILPAEIPVGVKGALVGKATWGALYEAAAAKVEAERAGGAAASA